MSDILMQALMGANQQDQYDNPWLRGAAAIGQQDYSGYDMKPWQRVLMGALGGFGSGFAGGVGKRQVDALAKQRNDSVMSGLKSGKLIEAITADPRLAEYAPFIEMEQAQSKQGRLQELNKALLPKGMMMTDEGQAPTRFFDPIEDEIRQAGGIERAKLQAKRDFAGQNTNTPLPELKDGVFGRPTAIDRKNSLIRDAIQNFNMTPNAALEYANKAMAPSALITQMAIKKTAAARTQADGLADYANKALMAIQDAGETGGGWMVNTPRDVLSKTAAFLGNDDQQAKQTAQSQLDTIKPDIIKFSKQAGTGAMSDPEMNVYLGAGPSSDKTKLANEDIAKGIQAIAKIAEDYADFADY
jgi:hypothetical protein